MKTFNLKKFNKTLWQIHQFIIGAEKLGYGEVELVIKTHDYISKKIEMKARKPKKKTIRKSIRKGVQINERSGLK